MPVKVKLIGVVPDVAVTVSYAIFPLVTNSDWVVAVKTRAVTYVYKLDAVDVPDDVVTTTSLLPTVPTGVVIEIVVEVLEPIVAAVPPIVTPVTPENEEPEITVEVPPSVDPEFTVIELMIGADAST